jgi:hypothetical protein
VLLNSLPPLGCLAVGGSPATLTEPCNTTLTVAGLGVVEAVKFITLYRRLLAAVSTAFRVHGGSLKLKLPTPLQLSLSGMRFSGQVWYSSSSRVVKRCTVWISTAQQHPDAPFSMGSSKVRYVDLGRINSAQEGGKVNTLTIPRLQAYRAKITDAPLIYLLHSFDFLNRLRHRWSLRSIRGPFAEVSVNMP